MKNYLTGCCLKWSGFCICLTGLFATELAASSLFDVHLHYNAEDAEHLSPQQVVRLLDRNKVEHALVTSRPTELALRLHQQAPERVFPLLGVYGHSRHKETWTLDKDLPSWIEQQLKKHNWCGIGELHLFAKDRHSEVFAKLIKLARQYTMPLLIHADPAVIDTVYEHAPEQIIIWAHAGTFPYPDLIADYLVRYPSLYVDLSVRDERIAPNGIISDNWYDLFARYPDRFMVGVDTFSLSRWQNFDQAVATIRHWLAQLDADDARRIMYDNAAILFKSCATNSN